MSEPRTSLWHHRDFMKLWGAQSISKLGTQLGALSLTALVFLHASPAQMGILAAATGAPVVVAALASGVWVDRVRRRPVLIASDSVRALLLGAVALGAALGRIGIGHVYVAGAITGAFTMLFDLAYRSYLPRVVGRAELVEGNRKLEASEAVAESGGASLGGVFVQVFGAPVCLAADAVTFAMSGVLVAMIRSPEQTPPPVAERRSVASEAVEGLRAMFVEPVLRALAINAAGFNFFGGFFVALYGVFVVRVLHLPVAVLGLLVGVGGLGAFAGSFLVGPAARRFGLGPMIVVAQIAAGATGFLTAFAGGPRALAATMLFASQLLGDPLLAMDHIAGVSVRQAITPDRLLGRVNAGMLLLEAGVLPIGALLGGWLGQTIGPRAALLIAVCAFISRGFGLLASPLWRMHELPVPS